MGGKSHEVVVGRNVVKTCGDTVVRTGLLVHVGLHEVAAEAHGEVLVELGVGGEAGVVALQVGAVDDTAGIGVAEGEDEVRGTGIVGYADVVAEGVAGLEEALDVVIDTGSRPGIEACFRTLRLVVHALVHSVGVGVAVGDISAVAGIVRKFADERTPGKRGLRAVLAAGTLGVLVLDLRIDGRRVEGIVRGEGDGGLARLGGGTLLRGDDDDTVGGAHSVEGGSGLALQHVDALDVVGIDIQRTAGIVGTGHGVAGAEVRGGSHGHSVHDVQRSVVAVERTGAADDDLGGSTRHTGRGRDLNAGELALEGGAQAGAGRVYEFVGLKVLNRVSEGFLLTGDTHGGHDDLIEELDVRDEFDVDGPAAFDGDFLSAISDG